MDVDKLAEHRAIDFTAAQLGQAVTACFESYIMPFVIDGLAFERRFRPEGLDTQASFVLKSGDDYAAACLIARQGWTSRVAAMAIAPSFRRQGVGQHLMSLVIDEARSRGDSKLVLEVIEQNPPAIALYESVGLAKTRRLVGYQRDAQPGRSEYLASVDPSIIFRRMVIDCDHDLPWDFRPETLAAKTAKMIGLSLENRAFAVVTESDERLILWTLFTAREERKSGYARRLVEAIAAKYPTKKMVTPVALPDDLAPGFFASMGFEQNEISQFEMAIKL